MYGVQGRSLSISSSQYCITCLIDLITTNHLLNNCPRRPWPRDLGLNPAPAPYFALDPDGFMTLAFTASPLNPSPPPQRPTRACGQYTADSTSRSDPFTPSMQNRMQCGRDLALTVPLAQGTVVFVPYSCGVPNGQVPTRLQSPPLFGPVRLLHDR